MVATRSATVKPKASVKATPKAGARDGSSGTKVAKDNRVVADMLRDLQIEGKALSAQIERLRHRFP